VIVVDASVLCGALTDDSPVGQACRAELARDSHWGAPEQLRVETFSAIRGLHRGAKISTQRARDAVNGLSSLAIERLATAALLPRMWDLRDNLSGYDAAYVAAAELWGCPMVTGDSRIARASGPRCEIRVISPLGADPEA
jgi:predicted nucleic acid-binding protein